MSSLISMEITPPTTSDSDSAMSGERPASPGTVPDGSNDTPLRDLPLDAIAPNPHQPRRHFNDTALASLAASFTAAGVIQPILVRDVGEGRFELIAGERRLRAAKLAGLATIPAIVREADTIAQAQMALIENTQRQDLNPIERAIAYRTLLQELNLTQADLAQRLGEDRSSIANFLRLLDLPAGVRTHVETGVLSLGHAKVLAALSDAATIETIARQAVAGDWSVRTLEQAIAKSKSESPLKSAPLSPDNARQAHLLETASSISRTLGMKVKLAVGKKGSGKLTIQYGSLEQFDELMEKLGVKLEAM